MFDNVKQPEDIFEGVESASPPPPLPVVTLVSDLPASPSAFVESAGGSPWKTVVIVVTVIVVVGAAAALAYFLLASRTPVTPGVPNVSTSVPEVTPEPAPKPEEPEPAVEVPAAIVPTASVDRDKDGLSDADESKLGTSPTSSDTDADGLFDKEEVETYKTDPLDPDTDGDGFQDGAEVKNGYNPIGTGKLFEVPTE